MTEVPNILPVPEAPLPPIFELTPESGRMLSDWLAGNDFTLWGHGTPTDDKYSFFTHGIRAGGENPGGGYDSVASIAIPIRTDDDNPEYPDITKLDYMTHWPMKRDPNKESRVVLMAVPNGDIERGLPSMVIDEHILDLSNPPTFPADLIVGFFNPDTMQVERNPQLRLTAELRKKYLAAVEAEIKSIQSREWQIGGAATIQSVQFITPPSNDNSEHVW